MMRAYRFEHKEQGGFPVLRAAKNRPVPRPRPA
jgi:hypothetical protein